MVEHDDFMAETNERRSCCHGEVSEYLANTLRIGRTQVVMSWNRHPTSEEMTIAGRKHDPTISSIKSCTSACVTISTWHQRRLKHSSAVPNELDLRSLSKISAALAASTLFE